MSHDWPALYRAVVEDLDSDEPRLVLADALQDAGDPHGELIAIQCELSKLGADRTTLAGGRRRWLNDAQAHGDRSRIEDLRQLERAWITSHPPLLPRPDLYEIERGLVSYIHGAHLGSVSNLLDKAPAVEAMAFELALPGEYLFSEPRLLQLRQLRLQFMPREVDRYPAHEFLDKLEHVRHYAPSGFDHDPPEVDRMLPRAMRPTLEGLEVSPRLLARLPLHDLRRVRHLALRRGPGLADLPPSFAAQLAILELESDFDCLSTLAPRLTSLHALRLTPLFEDDRLELYAPTDFMQLAPGVGEAIGASLHELRLLSLTGFHVGPSISAMLSGPGLEQLAELTLKKCLIGSRGLAAVVAAAAVGRLERLCLESCRLIDDVFDSLAALGHLRVLELRDMDAGDRARERVRQALPSTSVRWS